MRRILLLALLLVAACDMTTAPKPQCAPCQDDGVDIYIPCKDRCDPVYP